MCFQSVMTLVKTFCVVCFSMVAPWRFGIGACHIFLAPSANVEFKDWLKDSIKRHDIIIAIIIWKIWYLRIVYLFEGTKHFGLDISAQVVSMLRHVSMAFENSDSNHIQGVVRSVSWKSPPPPARPLSFS